MSAMDFLNYIQLGSRHPVLPVPGILRFCNYLQNAVATTYIFVLQLSTFLFYNKHSNSSPVMIENSFMICLPIELIANVIVLLAPLRQTFYSITISPHFLHCETTFFNIEKGKKKKPHTRYDSFVFVMQLNHLKFFPASPDGHFLSYKT